MTGGRKSTEKSAGSSGIKSFFVSKTPQAKPKDDSPQATKENCIDLSKDDKDAAKPAKAAPADTNMFFMSRVRIWYLDEIRILQLTPYVFCNTRATDKGRSQGKKSCKSRRKSDRGKPKS